MERGEAPQLDRSKPRRVSSGTRLFVIGSHKSHIAHRKQPTFAIAMCPSSSPTILHSMPSIQDDARADDDSVNTKKSSNQTLSSASSFATIDSTNLVDLNNHAARILQAEGLLVSSTGGSEKTTMTLSKKQSRRMRTSGKQRASDSLAFSPDNFFAAPTMSDNEVGNATNRSPTRTSGERKIGSPTSVIPAVNSVARPSTLKASNIIRPSKTLVSIEEQYSQSLDGSDDSSNDIREKFSPSISVEDESKSLATEFAKSHAKSPLDRLHDLINGSFCVSKETLINQIQNQCTEENLVDDIWEESVIDDVVDALVEEDSDYDDDTCSGTFATYDDEDTYASSLHSSQGRLRRGRSLTARHGYNSDGESVSPRVSRSRSTLDSSGTSNRRTKSRRYPDADDASGEDITVAESVLSQDHSTWKSMTNAATTGEEDASNEGFKSSTKAVLESSKYPRESSAAEGYFKKLLTVGIQLHVHNSDNKRQGKMTLAFGSRSNGRFDHPQLVWSGFDETKSVDLFDIVSIRKPTPFELDNHPHAAPAHCFFIETSSASGCNILFEAVDEIQTRRVMSGLAHIVGKLARWIVAGDDSWVSQTMLANIGSVDTVESSVPCAMVDVTNHLVQTAKSQRQLSKLQRDALKMMAKKKRRP